MEHPDINLNIEEAASQLDRQWSDARYRILAGEVISLEESIGAFKQASALLADPSLAREQVWPLDRIRNEAFERVCHSLNDVIRSSVIKALSKQDIKPERQIVREHFSTGQFAVELALKDIDHEGRPDYELRAFMRKAVPWRMIDILREESRDRRWRSKIKVIEEARTKYAALKVKPCPEESFILRELGMPEEATEEEYQAYREKYLEAWRAYSLMDPHSLNSTLGPDPDSMEQHEILIDLTQLEREETLEDVVRAVAEDPNHFGLSQREMLILYKYGVEDKRLAQVGHELGVTESAASLAVKKIAAKIRAKKDSIDRN